MSGRGFPTCGCGVVSPKPSAAGPGFKRGILTSTAIVLTLGTILLASQHHAFADSFGTFQADSNGLSPNNTGPASNAAPGTTSSVAIGINAKASSPTGSGDSISIGTDTSATNQDSIAIGAQTTASGVNTIAIGNNGTTASGDAADVFGVGSIGSGLGSSVFGSDSFVNSAYGSAFGSGSSVSAIGGSAIGSTASATSAYGTALGFGSVASRAAMAGSSEAFSNTVVNSPYGALSIGAPGYERQITNVAGGTQDTDAVNVRQLRAVGNSVADSLGGGAGFNPTTNAYTAPTYNVGGISYSDVAGAMTASNNLAVQYTPDANGNPTNVVDLTKGGSLNPVSITGLAPATTGSGAVSLSQLPLQYSTSGAPTTANPATSSNDVTLLGTNGSPVTLHNVAPGALTSTSTDAVNGSQLFTTNQNEANDATNIASLRGSLDNGTIGLVQQDQTTRAINVGANTDGTLVDFTNNAGAARLLNGVAAGTLSSTSTQAVNGSQLYATNQAEAADAANIANLNAGIAAGTLGLIQQDQTTRNITIGANTDGTNIDLTNNAGAARTLSGVADGTLSATSTQAVNGSQLYATNQTVAGLANGSLGLVQQNPTTRDLTVGANTDGTIVDFANSSGAARTLTNVAAGQIASGSTQAVNGGQVYSVAASIAQNFGGGSTVNPDGTVSAPTYTVQGNTYSNVGSAIGGLDTAVSDINAHGSKYFAVNTTGAAASAIGTDTVAIGPSASAIADGGVALGANSVASRNGMNGAQEAFSNTSVASTAGAVSVGAAGAERQITNVAGGTAPTDAVNVRQLTAVGGQVATVLGGWRGVAVRRHVDRADLCGAGQQLFQRWHRLERARQQHREIRRQSGDRRSRQQHCPARWGCQSAGADQQCRDRTTGDRCRQYRPGRGGSNGGPERGLCLYRQERRRCREPDRRIAVADQSDPYRGAPGCRDRTCRGLAAL